MSAIVYGTAGATPYLDFWVIGGDAVTDKAKGHREGLVHVNLGMRHLVHDPVRGVEASGSGADDGHAEGGILGAWHEAGYRANSAPRTPSPMRPMGCPWQHCE